MNLAKTSRREFFKDQLIKEERNAMRQRNNEEIEPDEDEEEHLSFSERVATRFLDSSLCLFYKKSKIRQWCMKLAEPPENLMILKMIEKAGSYEAYL